MQSFTSTAPKNFKVSRRIPTEIYKLFLLKLVLVLLLVRVCGRSRRVIILLEHIGLEVLFLKSRRVSCKPFECKFSEVA